eukprot:CAMPEP_0118941680 /NCGR_PEP_ID=MMETSP1169-20130426/34429_1 /TAXON_ID=36882 /ORGANISM="Pyramimonas obovata, Strain CCMP722" /LENGTH=332 /DNA_ID=CAMNT_0006886509 /DNA_START=222 /DNA_END=1216 /DNA_ORIENTATION=-
MGAVRCWAPVSYSSRQFFNRGRTNEARRRTVHSIYPEQQWRRQRVGANALPHFQLQATGVGKGSVRRRVIRTSAASDFKIDGQTYKYHVTQPGDKLMGIAKKYRTTVPDLMWFNGSMYLADASTDNGLKPGTIIIVFPTRKSAPSLTYFQRDGALAEAVKLHQNQTHGAVATSVAEQESALAAEQRAARERAELMERKRQEERTRKTQLEERAKEMEREARELVKMQNANVRQEQDEARALAREAKLAEERALKEAKAAEVRALKEAQEAAARARQQEAREAAARAEEARAIEKAMRAAQARAAEKAQAEAKSAQQQAQTKPPAPSEAKPVP